MIFFLRSKPLTPHLAFCIHSILTLIILSAVTTCSDKEVPGNGSYTIQIRVTGQPGKIQIMKGADVLTTLDATPPEGGFTTVKTILQLASDAQTVRVICDAAVQGINWLSFTRND